MPERGTLLVAGASGLVGSAAAAHFAALGGWDVIGVSRRAPPIAGVHYRHLKLDLVDPAACAAALAPLEDVTHVIYAALVERPGLVEGWRDRALMRTNLALLRNLMEPLLRSAPGLRHVSLLQGTKAYGAHLHPIRVPAREDAPRDPHENFYWLQEDWLREAAGRHGFAWTILRPQIVFGGAIGVAMNPLPAIGAYAAICREEGRPFGFPGGPDLLLEAVDARLLARALEWAATSPQCRFETFNVANGDVFVWRNVWPTIAASLGVEPGPDSPLRLSTFLTQRAHAWERIVERRGLRRIRLPELLGESHHYVDFLFAAGIDAGATVSPALVSTVKSRRFGFADCIDTEEMLRHWLGALVEQRILPG